MHHESPANDVVYVAVYLDQVVVELENCSVSPVRLDVAQVSDVSHFVAGASVGQACGVVVSARGDTAVREVSEFVDVESVLASGEPVDGSLDLDFLA